MPRSPDKGRLYVPPPRDPDDAGPIASSCDRTDFAIVSSMNAESGRYKYERLVPIVIEAGRPLELPRHKEDRPTCTSVTTHDMSVVGKQLLMSWFPYSNDWEANSVFLNYSQKSKLEKKQRLLEFLSTFEKKRDVNWSQYFEDPSSIDPFNSSRSSTVSYVLNPRRSSDCSSKKVFSQRNQHRTGKGGIERRGKWLAIGICDNIDEAVRTILAEPGMQALLHNEDAFSLWRLWKNHQAARPFRLREELLDLNYRETILKCAIRKAIAGPIDKPETFVGEPVATWATSVFLETLYNLNRRYPDENLDDAIDHDTVIEVNPPGRNTPEPTIDFMMLVSSEIRSRGSKKHRNIEKLMNSAMELLDHSNFNYRLAGLARLKSLTDDFDLHDSLGEKLHSMASDDPEFVVREAAKSVLEDLES